MAKLDFSEILNQQVGSAPKPKPIPEGTYFGTIAGIPTNRIANTKEGEKPIVAFNLALTEPGDDVNQDDLAEAGGLLSPSGDAKRVRKDFWLTDDSRHQLDTFLENLGITGSYVEAFQAVPGREVMVYITLDSFQSKSGEERQVNNVTRIFARE